MDDPARLPRALGAGLALVSPLAAALLVVGLAPSGVPCSSPAHPRSLVAPCAAPTAPEGQAARSALVLPQRSDPGARQQVLMRRVASELKRGESATLPAVSEARLLRLLVDLDLDAGRLEGALATLRAADAEADAWVHAGWRLSKGRQPELARRAFVEALRREPANAWAFQSLRELDPAAALAALARRPRGASDGDWRVATHARLLIDCGRVDEAREVLVAGAGGAQLGSESWKLFEQLAPESALETLRLRATTGEDAGALSLYAARLHGLGDVEGAVALLERACSGPARDAALEALCELDPRRAAAALRSELARRPDAAELWEQLGNAAADQGNVEASHDAWLRVLELDPDSAPQWVLWQHRREDFLRVMRLHAEHAEPDDARWAWEECGDWLWRSGRAHEAVDAWSRARALDPEDQDLRAKLERARLGQWALSG